jgi:four helix bundle protein
MGTFRMDTMSPYQAGPHHSWPMNKHRTLLIWQFAGELIDAVYVLADQLPPRERYVADPQLRRAAWSVQNNIAEGYAKRGRAEYRKFLDVSLGSLGEIDSMVAKLADMYRLDQAVVGRIESLRRRITAGIFALMRSGRS